jgi:hypothetical protein
MINSQSNPGDDGPRIDVTDYFELRSWAKRLGVTPAEVRRAVVRVGDRAKDVETYLGFEQSMSRGQPGCMSGEPAA